MAQDGPRQFLNKSKQRQQTHTNKQQIGLHPSRPTYQNKKKLMRSKMAQDNFATCPKKKNISQHWEIRNDMKSISLWEPFWAPMGLRVREPPLVVLCSVVTHFRAGMHWKALLLPHDLWSPNWSVQLQPPFEFWIAPLQLSWPLV